MSDVTVINRSSRKQRVVRRPPGRWSESYPPEKRILSYGDWPEGDRLALEQAMTAPGPFDIARPASRWRPATVQMRRRAYGRYLNWLMRQGVLSAEEAPADRFTPERLTLYLQEYRSNASPVSVDQALRELRQVGQALAPLRNWSWITRHPLAPRPAEIRSAKRARCVFSPIELLHRALDLMDRLDRAEPSLDDAVLYRDALMAALLCMIPLRRRNLADIRIGEHLVIDGEVMRLTFEQTKTAALIEAIVPVFLCRYIRNHIDHHRAVLLAGNDCNALWINHHHRALEYERLHESFARIGRLLLGRPINIHAFRYSVATAIMTRDPRRGSLAAGVLGHKGLRSVVTYYDRSGDAGARREWARIRRQLTRSG